MFDGKVAVNIAYIIGNSPLRICAVGWDDKPANEAERANMRAMLREGFEIGQTPRPIPEPAFATRVAQGVTPQYRPLRTLQK